MTDTAPAPLGPELLDDDRSEFDRIVAPLAALDEAERAEALDETLDQLDADALAYLMSWEGQARPSQRIDPNHHALLEAIIGGRGSGKTRTGAEGVCDRIEAGKLQHGCFVSRTMADVEGTMIRGPKSGFSTVATRRGIGHRWVKSADPPTIYLEGGARISCYSSFSPEGPRGDEFDTAWGDEFGAWAPKVDEMGGTAFSNLVLALRLGEDPLGIFTTTPRATAQMREVMANESGLWNVRRMATLANAANLPPGWILNLLRMWGGTRLYAQEVLGQYVEDVEGALWSTARLEASRVVPADRGYQLAGMTPADAIRAKIAVVEAVAGGLPWRWVAVDPSFAEDGGGDECGIVLGGVGNDRRFYVIADLSGNYPPEQWAEIVTWVYELAGCTAAVVEANMDKYGVSKTLNIASPRMPIEWVNARTSKRARAEPISTLWHEAPGELWVPPHTLGLASIVGSLPGLEAECTGWDSRSKFSPNRIDALAWLGWKAAEHLFTGETTFTATAGLRLPTGL